MTALNNFMILLSSPFPFNENDRFEYLHDATFLFIPFLALSFATINHPNLKLTACYF